MGDEAVGIFARRQKGKAQRIAGLQMRQRQMRGAMRGLQSGSVAVKGQNGFGRGAPQKMQLILGQRGAQWRHGMGEAGAHHRDHIHIAFGHDDGAGLDGGGTGGGEIVEIVSPWKRARFRRVLMYLGLASASRPRPPKAMTRPRPSVMVNITRLKKKSRIGRPSSAGRARPAAIMSSWVTLWPVRKSISALFRRRIAQTELFGRRAIQATALQIVARLAARRPRATVFIEFRRQLHDLVERFLLLFARLVFRRPFGQFHPGFRRQLFHRFGKAEAIGFDQPFERIAALAAAEAFVAAPFVLDLEAGGFLLWKGQHPHISRPLRISLRGGPPAGRYPSAV